MTDAERIAKLEAEREKDKRTIEDLVAAERAADGVLEASEARCRALEGALRYAVSHLGAGPQANPYCGCGEHHLLNRCIRSVIDVARAALAQQGRSDPCRKDPQMLCPVVGRVADCSSECPYPDMVGPAREAPSAGKEEDHG